MAYVFFKVDKVCDIYRLQDGQLAEHWDIIKHNAEDIPPRNSNGIF